jgi:deoxyribonuclease-4
MRIGAHVSAAGGLSKVTARAQTIGAETIQIFASPPQGFAPPAHDDQAIEEFNTKTQEAAISPVFIHAIYLINLASSRPELLSRSISSLTEALRFAAKIRSAGVIYHTGSAGTASFKEVSHQITRAMGKILSDTPSETKLIVENSAGQGGTVGAKFSEIGSMISDLASDRVACCLDTQHAFATGYDLSRKDGITRMLTEWDKEIGLDKMICLHVNDSKVACGSGRDRHENIGQGLIGDAGFKLLRAQPELSSLPWILEVPGIDGKSGPDAANIEHLRRLASLTP